jgi:hypothetical protein
MHPQLWTRATTLWPRGDEVTGPPIAVRCPIDTNDGLTTSAGLAQVRWGVYLSAARCLVTYLLMPGLGIVGVVGGVLGFLGTGIQVIGAVLCSVGAYRLWRAQHWARYGYVAVAASVYLVTAVHLVGAA